MAFSVKGAEGVEIKGGNRNNVAEQGTQTATRPSRVRLTLSSAAFHSSATFAPSLINLDAEARRWEAWGSVFVKVER